jgi:hypothetical protein
MKKLLAMGFLGLGLLAGCNGPIPAFQDPNTALQVSISDYGPQWQLRVQPPQPERVPGGALKVTVPVYNTTIWDYSIDYRVEFMDKNGMKLEDPSATGWQVAVMPPHGYQYLTATSMSPLADNFHVYIRPANR